MLDLDGIVRASQDLAPLAESAIRLAQTLAKEDWDIEDLVRTIELDPPLTGRVLARANSAAAGARVEASHVRQALMRVGPGAVVSMAIGAAAKADLSASLEPFGLAGGALWRHSVAAALTIEALRSFRIAAPPEAFTAAILHDVGNIVLAPFVGDVELDLARRSRELGQCSWIEAEMEIYGVHHGEIGGLIAENWRLPPAIVAGIRYHHDPAGAPSEYRALCEHVALADSIANQVGACDGQDATVPPDQLGLTESQLEELQGQVTEALDVELERFG